jgi:hypothetical protein
LFSSKAIFLALKQQNIFKQKNFHSLIDHSVRTNISRTQ